MLESCELEPPEARRQKNRLKAFFRILHGQLKINKDEYLKLPGKRSSRVNHNYVLLPYFARSDVFRHSFFPAVIELWNALPNFVVNASDVCQFEKLLDMYLNDSAAT